jgi:hypothetical protein
LLAFLIGLPELDQRVFDRVAPVSEPHITDMLVYAGEDVFFGSSIVQE